MSLFMIYLVEESEWHSKCEWDNNRPSKLPWKSVGSGEAAVVYRVTI